MKKYLLFLIVILMPTFFFAQDLFKKDTITRLAIIEYDIKGNQLNFTPKVPDLMQISGAPTAFYSYYWEFGDGKYSKKKAPKHIYKSKGDYEVKLWVTNHYDVGKPPATRPQKLSVKEVDQKSLDVALMTDDFTLQKNREPIPNEEIVLVMSYKNLKNYVTDGKLFLFYNERKYKANNFELGDVRTHHNEKQIKELEELVYAKDVDYKEMLYASMFNGLEDSNMQIQDSTRTNLTKTIEDSKNIYKNWNIFNFDEMDPDKERNIFFTLKTTPEMLKDTSAIISIRGVYLPDNNYKNHKVKEMEMEIVTSHDPNNMSSNGTFLNYRLVRFKTLKYKIRFQNNGEGPANTIRLETDIPEMLDKSTLKVLDMYPKCRICPKKKVAYSCLDTTFTKEQAVFTFRNIYLPGSEQKGVKERDSTKGFVKYSIKFGKDFHKIKTKSKTAIIFDKNEPIITNRSTTRFLPGISIGVKTGYNYFSKLKNSKDYFVGATISPFKSYRWYWQAEFLNSFHSYNGNITIKTNTEGGKQGVEDITRITTITKYNNIDWTIPLLVRYNVNNYIGLGAGMQGTLSVDQKKEKNIFTEVLRKTGDDTRLISSMNENDAFQKSFTNFRKGLLLEITGGFARIGPSLGARYIVNYESDFNYWQFYAIWKF